MDKKDGYSLTKQWFEFAAENMDKIKPIHGILYLWCVELNNRLKWAEKFGLPMYDTMKMIGVSSHNTYKKAFDDLIEWGFIKLITKSKNQYTANIIALSKYIKPKQSAKSNSDTAEAQHYSQHYSQHRRSTVPILKQEETIKTKENTQNQNLEADFINSIIFLFQEVYKNLNGVPYVINDEKDIPAAAGLVQIYKTEMQITDESQLQTSLKAYFEAVINHPDNFHKTRMDLPYLVKNFNRVNNSLLNGKPKGAFSEMQWRAFEEKVKLDFNKKHINGAWDKPEEPAEVNPIPPSMEEVEKYFTENGYTKEAAKFVFQQFSLWNWKGKAGSGFINTWKNKAEELYFINGPFFKKEYMINQDSNEF